MDTCMLVVTADRALAEVLRPQVENQGCRAVLADSYDEASMQLDRVDAALVDLELPGGGLDVVHRFRIQAPSLGIIAIATNEADADAAREHADRVLREPFTIADVVAAVRDVSPSPSDDVVIDLRSAAAERGVPATADDGLPWFATR